MHELQNFYVCANLFMLPAKISYSPSHFGKVICKHRSETSPYHML